MNHQRERILREAGIDTSLGESMRSHVVTYRVPGGDSAVQLWRVLSTRASELGGWPVILGDAKEFAEDKEDWVESTKDGPEAILARVPVGDPLIALKRSEEEERQATLKWLEENPTPGSDSLRAIMAKAATDDDSKKCGEPDFAGWPKQPVAGERQVYSVFDHKGRARKQCILAVVEAADPCDVPAVLGFGGFNACPAPEIHVAILRSWKERYGAVPICLTRDVIELSVAKPLATPEEAWHMAHEQYRYCVDIVDQGTESVERLAQELWKSPYWFFWWD